MVIRLTSLVLLLLCACSSKNELEKIITNTPELSAFLTKKDSLEIAIIYTQIDRDSAGNPSFRTFSYNYDSTNYFYPASTVKFPIALLALEKLNKLNIAGLNRETTMVTDSAFSGQTPVKFDSTAENYEPSVGHYIKKIFQVSDNDAFNRLYEFLGQDYINDGLAQKGYKGINIVHRLSIPLTEDENLATNPIHFLKNDSILYSQPLIKAGNIYERNSVKKGIGYLKNGELVSEPMDFSKKNLFPLHAQHEILRDIIFPQHENEKFYLTNEDYKFLYKWMSTLPGESDFPNYSELPENYVKFLMFGVGKKNIPKNIKVFNKVGVAYGYVIDNAYIIDTETQVEFLLSAVIHSNKNRI